MWAFNIQEGKGKKKGISIKNANKQKKIMIKGEGEKFFREIIRKCMPQIGLLRCCNRRALITDKGSF